MTPTFGRERDVEMLRRLLSSRTATSRLISLVGPGGIGKTRVALESGANASNLFPDGVWFIRIEGDIRSAEDVAILVAESLPFPVSVDSGDAAPTKSFLRAVTVALSGQRILLIFDDCESSVVTSAVGAFAKTLLSDLPLATVLLTSRSRLGVPNEIVYPLGALEFGSQKTTDKGDPTASNPAFELFCARAQIALPQFDVSEDRHRQIVDDICRQLEGIPLAIEVAAAHVAQLPLAEIALGLTQLPHDGSRRLSVMHRLFEWAHNLLAPDDQALLGALSVFENGFDSEAASAMTGFDGTQDESLRLLADRSLISRRMDGSGRYALHSLVQNFARRKLAISSCENAVRVAHADYFVALAARHGAEEPNAERERAGFDRLELDLTNLRVAVEHLRLRAPEDVPRIVADLSNFLRYRGHLREWRSWLPLALRLLPEQGEQPTMLGARLHLYRAASFADSNASDNADRHIDVAYGSALVIEAWEIAAKALNLRSVLRSRAQRWNDAFAALQEARSLYRRARSEYGEVVAINNLGLLAAKQSNADEARRWFEEGASLARAIGDRRGLAIAVGNLGYLAQEDNDLATARRCFEEGLREARALRDAKRVAQALLNLGDVLNRQKDWESGTPLLAIAEAMFVRQRDSCLPEAIRCLALAEPRFGSPRLEELRREFSRLSLPQLLQLNPARYTPLTFQF